MEEYQQLLSLIMRDENAERQESMRQNLDRIAMARGIDSGDKPKKRKVSAYSREFGRQYRAMRKKHPRMSHGAITKKAHIATRRIRKS